MVSKGSRRLRSFKNNHEGSRRFKAQYGHVQGKFGTFWLGEINKMNMSEDNLTHNKPISPGYMVVMPVG